VALRRAAHQLVDTPPLVFADPLAVRILGPAHKEELQRTPDALRKPYSASLRAWMVARARLAEDTLAAAYRQHNARQYLVLGAGLDTFACRQHFAGLRVFEVDHPATQTWKREMLAAAGIDVPASATLVPVDFERDSLRDQLTAAGFDFAQPTVTAWLGVVPYLTRAAFRATLALLAQFAPGSEAVFDYAQPREALSPVQQKMHDSISARVAQAGEPFQLFFTPQHLAAELTGAGLRVAEDVGAEELNALYFGDRSDGLALKGSSGRICIAGIQIATAETRIARDTSVP
jgi:methyltransferase (TIGR00027 family)